MRSNFFFYQFVKRRLSRKMFVVFFVSFVSVFTLFNVLIYSVTQNVFLRNERVQINESITNMVERLSEAEEPLTLGNLSEILYQNATSDHLVETSDGSYYFLRTERDVTNMLYPNQSIYIYDADSNLLFTTDETGQTPPLEVLDMVLTVPFKNTEGYLLTRIIYGQDETEVLGYVQVFHDLGQYREFQRTLWLLSTLVLEFSGIMLVFWLIVVSTSRFLKPLTKLHQVMDHIATHPNDLSVRSNLKTGDEIEELSVIFDGMLDRLQAYSDLQTRFISDVSHELRTPIAVVEGHLNLLRRWGKDDPLILEESLLASHEETRRMGRMVQEMLNLVRLRGSLDQHKHETPDIYGSVQALVANFKLIHPEVTISFTSQRQDYQVAMYQPHLEQALTIILDNAVKYSEDAPVIDVALYAENDKVVASIRDQGLGISEEDLGKIFDRFYRTDQSRTKLTAQSGLGIGLSILKQLVDAYDCDISVDSQLGVGTTFFVKIPRVNSGGGGRKSPY